MATEAEGCVDQQVRPFRQVAEYLLDKDGRVLHRRLTEIERVGRHCCLEVGRMPGFEVAPHSRDQHLTIRKALCQLSGNDDASRSIKSLKDHLGVEGAVELQVAERIGALRGRIRLKVRAWPKRDARLCRDQVEALAIRRVQSIPKVGRHQHAILRIEAS